MTVVERMPEADYFADRAFSFSGAKRILPPNGCPALFRHEQLHGRPPKPAFDFGHAVHGFVLHEGEPLVVIDADDWRSKTAREERDAAYAEGKVPLLRAEHDKAKAAAEAVLTHERAGRLFTDGVAERSLFWTDPVHEVNRKCRIDWQSGERVVDLKTCVSAEPSEIAKAVARYSYHQQHPWYLDGVKALGLAEDPTFTFVFVEKEPPHLVTVCELDTYAVEKGRRRNDEALALYAECLAFDSWPAYSDEVEVISLPGWAA